MKKEFKVVWHIDKKECNCPNWLHHWMRATHKKVSPNCSVSYCANSARTGGHTVACDDSQGEVFVVPLCRDHDSSLFTERFRINQKVKLIPVTKLKTCER